MWKCRVCGGELKRIVGIKYTSSVTMLKNGYPSNVKEIEDREVEENKVEHGTEYLGVECPNCSGTWLEPEEIGIWVAKKRRKRNDSNENKNS